MFRNNNARHGWMITDANGMLRQATRLEAQRAEFLEAQRAEANVAERNERAVVQDQITIAPNIWGSTSVNQTINVLADQVPMVASSEPSSDFDRFAEDLMSENDDPLEGPLHDKKSANKIQEVITDYNAVFEQVIEKLQGLVGAQTSSEIRELMYNCSFFMDDAFELKLLFKSKKAPSYSIYFKPSESWNKLYKVLNNLNAKGLLSRSVTGGAGFKIKKGFVTLRYEAAALSPEDRLEEWKRNKHKKLWFQHQGSYYEPITGRSEVNHSLTGGRGDICILMDNVPMTTEVVGAWLRIPATYENVFVDPDSFHSFLNRLLEKTIEQNQVRIRRELASGRDPFGDTPDEIQPDDVPIRPGVTTRVEPLPRIQIALNNSPRVAVPVGWVTSTGQ